MTNYCGDVGSTQNTKGNDAPGTELQLHLCHRTSDINLSQAELCSLPGFVPVLYL